MFKEVVRSMETGLLGYVGLFAFLFAFVLIVIRVALMKRSDRQTLKNMPLDDDTEFHAGEAPDERSESH